MLAAKLIAVGVGLLLVGNKHPIMSGVGVVWLVGVAVIIVVV